MQKNCEILQTTTTPSATNERISDLKFCKKQIQFASITEKLKNFHKPQTTGYLGHLDTLSSFAVSQNSAERYVDNYEGCMEQKIFKTLYFLNK